MIPRVSAAESAKDLRIAPSFSLGKVLPHHYGRIAVSLVVSNMHTKGRHFAVRTRSIAMRGQSGKASSGLAPPVVKDEPKGLTETPLGTVCPVI